MCRYGGECGPYKTHHACFTCRKAFKQPPIEDYLEIRGRGFAYKELERLWQGNRRGLERREQELGIRFDDLLAEYRDAIHKCPECGEPMVDMGFDFKPPRQSDVKAWQTLRGMYRVGHAFLTCGCDGPKWIPKSSADYRHYLERQREQYEKQLAYVQRQADLPPDRKGEAVEYWGSRIDAIDRERAALS
jgi:hypothetical protein